MIERKGGRTFSLRVLLRANFVFLFSKFSSVLSSLHTVPLCCSFFFLFPFFFFLSPLSLSLSLPLCLSLSVSPPQWFCLLACWLLLCVFSWGIWTPGGCAFRRNARSKLSLRPVPARFSGHVDVLRVGMNNGAAPWCSGRGHALVSATVAVRRGAGAGSRAVYFPGFLSSTCERVAARTCPEDGRGRADH